MQNGQGVHHKQSRNWKHWKDRKKWPLFSISLKFCLDSLYFCSFVNYEQSSEMLRTFVTLDTIYILIFGRNDGLWLQWKKFHQKVPPQHPFCRRVCNKLPAHPPIEKIFDSEALNPKSNFVTHLVWSSFIPHPFQTIYIFYFLHNFSLIVLQKGRLNLKK